MYIIKIKNENYDKKTAGIIFLSLLFLWGCKKCDGENPKARITNNSKDDAIIHIATPQDSTYAVFSIKKGYITDYQEFPKGKMTLYYSIGTKDTSVILTLTSCRKYNIAIDKEYKVTLFSKEIK